jgi:Heterokaryon incompatibility protein Het-C
MTTQQIVRCWDDHGIDAENQINLILKALHHPFNANNMHIIQVHMLAAVKHWWDLKTPENKVKLRECLSKDAAQNCTNRILVADPHALNPTDEKGPARFAGSNPHTEEPPLTMGEKIFNTLSDLTDKANAVSDALKNLLKPATSDNPNPIDRALAPIGLAVEQIFKDISLQEIASAPNIGNIAKEVIITQLEDLGRSIDDTAKDINAGFAQAVNEVTRFLPWNW